MAINSLFLLLHPLNQCVSSDREIENERAMVFVPAWKTLITLTSQGLVSFHSKQTVFHPQFVLKMFMFEILCRNVFKWLQNLSQKSVIQVGTHTTVQN